MLKNHLKLALRRIQKQKLHSFINIGGLALGIACFLIMSAYVIRELSYDDFHRDKDNIYRVCRIEKEPSGMIFSAATPHALAKALKNDYPVLKNVVSVISGFEDEINSKEKLRLLRLNSSKCLILNSETDRPNNCRETSIL